MRVEIRRSMLSSKHKTQVIPIPKSRVKWKVLKRLMNHLKANFCWRNTVQRRRRTWPRRFKTLRKQTMIYSIWVLIQSTMRNRLILRSCPRRSIRVNSETFQMYRRKTSHPTLKKMTSGIKPTMTEKQHSASTTHFKIRTRIAMGQCISTKRQLIR